MVVEEVWNEYIKTKSIESRNKLIIQYLPVVKKIVNIVLQGTGNLYIREDFYGVGVFGLMDAIKKYDKSKKVKFETYASIRVKGAIKDYMRKQDWVSRGVREKHRRIIQAEAKLREKLLRDPSDEEISKETGLSMNEIYKTIEKVTCADIISFEHAVSNGFMSLNKTFEEEYNPEKVIVNKELKDLLYQAVESLGDREKKIISLYYKEELTLKEIGYVMDISESRVSQIMKKTILKLREKLKQ